MTRSADPFPTDPYRRYPPVEGRPVPPAAGAARPYSASQQAPSPARRSRLSGAIFVVLGVVLLIGIAGTLSYVAHRNHWIDLSDRTSPNTTGQQPIEDMTVIFPGDESALSAAQGNIVQADRSNPSIIWIRSSLTRAKSSGSTDGVSVKVPSSLSGKVAGKRIRVTVSAARGKARARSPFAVAYSTGGAGSSGWLVFDPSPEFQDFSFRYRVPARAEGFTHYVGLWSDISGRETPLAVRRITITTLP